MRAHIKAIEHMLNTAGIRTYYTNVPERPSLPYVLLWSTSGMPSDEQPVGALHTDLTDQIGATCVAGDTYGVLTLRSTVRTVLDDSQPPVPGRLVELHLWDSQVTDLDRTVAPPVSYGVDIYQMTSNPA